MKQDIELNKGTWITGRWHRNNYLIKGKLGSGTVGTVYLCESNGKRYALKVSEKNASMTVEVNVLKALEKVQGKCLGPSLIDVDDWKRGNGDTYSFYVMEYIEGERIDNYIRRSGLEWIGVLMIQLLDDLERLHRSGWVLGDLKIEHLIVQSSPTKIRFLDVGGTTKRGRSIKEYTEFYDRGYWGLGTRIAEPSYDLFAFAMCFIAIFYPRQFIKGNNPRYVILKRLSQIRALSLYHDCLKRALLGEYSTSAAMKKDVVRLLHDQQKKKQCQRNSRVPSIGIFLLEVGSILLLATFFYITSLLY